MLLEHQDRRQWDQSLIARGFAHLARSAVGGEVQRIPPGSSHRLLSCPSRVLEKTNWQAIFYLYQLLWLRQPSPIVAFNRAIALGYANGALAGLTALLAIETLHDNHFYHAALGDFYRKTGDLPKTRQAYETALRLAALPREKQLLEEKIAQL